MTKAYEPIKISTPQGMKAAPAKQAAPSQSSLASLVLVAIAATITSFAISYFLFRGDVEVTPSVDTRSIACEATVDYVLSLADGQDALAAEVEAGQIKTRKQYFDRSVEISKAARLKSLMPIFEIDQVTLPEGEWDSAAASVVANHTRAVAQGQRSAVE